MTPICLYQRKLADSVAQCLLCPHYCKIELNNYGKCHARRNDNGILIEANYLQVGAVFVDPIEKKPLFHFLPGSKVLSIGTFGCNLKCEWCQNFKLVAGCSKAEQLDYYPLIEFAKENSIEVLAFTYNEPIVWYGTVLQVAKLAKKEGLRTVLVTNGFINEEPLLELLPYIDAFNIDLKAFSDYTYHKFCSGSLEPVKKTIERVYGHSHLEVTFLLINTVNSDLMAFKQMIEWLKTVSVHIPLHITKYFMNENITIPDTQDDLLEEFYNYAKTQLVNVYLGNVTWINIDTICPLCKETIIQRTYSPVSINLKDKLCNRCLSYKPYGLFK